MIVLVMLPETEKSKDWELQINQMKQALEKQLQSERTLKTQVGVKKSADKAVAPK